MARLNPSRWSIPSLAGLPGRSLLQPRFVLGACSVVIVAAVVFTAASLGPPRMHAWLLLAAVVAVGAALQSAALDPSDLTVALLFSLLPVLALVGERSPSWLVGPFAALLLLAAELNALAWECPATGPLSGVRRRRLINSIRLAAAGLVASLAVGLVAEGAAPAGTIFVIAAAAAIAGLGSLVFRPRA